MIKLLYGERYFLDAHPGMRALISTDVYIALPMCLSGIILSVLHMSSHLIFTAPQRSKYSYNSHFKDREMEL